MCLETRFQDSEQVVALRSRQLFLGTTGSGFRRFRHVMQVEQLRRSERILQTRQGAASLRLVRAVSQLSE